MVQEAVHEEIKWLEERLEAKKRELGEKGGEAWPERKIVRDIIKELSASPPPVSANISDNISDDAAQKAAYDLKEKEHAHIIEELVILALTKGLASALKIANSLKNPHILDEFHDTLADKYYEKLLQVRKLKA